MQRGTGQVWISAYDLSLLGGIGLPSGPIGLCVRYVREKQCEKKVVTKGNYTSEVAGKYDRM